MIQLAITLMLKNTSNQRQIHGFTLIELLVVMSILGILATMGTFTYLKAKSEQRDSNRTANMIILKDSLEKYYRDNGQYPFACTENGGSDNIACPIDNLASYLVPKYISSIPHDPKFFENPTGFYIDYEYVHTNVPDSYAIRVTYETKDPPWCKTGKNMELSWWGDGVPACDINSNILP